ncbi:hypothetical protein ACWDA7_33435 [Streptomyces sp. NPDC001156]
MSAVMVAVSRSGAKARAIHESSARHTTRQRHQQSGEEGSVLRGELHPVRTELPLKDHDLVAQGEDLRVLVAVAHR